MQILSGWPVLIKGIKIKVYIHVHRNKYSSGCNGIIISCLLVLVKIIWVVKSKQGRKFIKGQWKLVKCTDRSCLHGVGSSKTNICSLKEWTKRMFLIQVMGLFYDVKYIKLISLTNFFCLILTEQDTSKRYMI